MYAKNMSARGCPESSGRGTMYGMLLESIQHYVKELYGEDKWDAVLEHAGLHNMIFTTHKVYEDHIMNDLANSCASVLQDGTASNFMYFFGHCFVNFFSHYGYDKIMRISGRYYRDFLNGIDNLHETMRFSYPRLQSPSFYVEEEDRHGCILNYRSRRKGFTQYVVGQLKQCGVKFYSVKVDVIVLEERLDANGCHVIFRLNFDNIGFRPPQCQPVLSGSKFSASLPGQTFLKVFPFCLVFNSNLVIENMGQNLRRLLGDHLFDTDVRKTFQLRRPIMTFTWQNVLCLQKVIFELEARTIIKCCAKSKQIVCNCSPCEKRETANSTVILRGQMKFIKDWNSVAFLCTPLLGNLQEMESIGIYINDLSLHDNSRGMVLAGFQHASHLEHSIDKQMEKSKLIADNLHKLDMWRQKSETLLYSMIPKSIAVRLKNGIDPVDTCETFDQVTILFSYIIGFMDICVNVSALKVVECINKVFTLFDLIVDKYNVFKVETLGDAVYMVAGGVPDRTPDHAVNVAGLALELLNQATQLTNPATKQKLKIRIGMHTGGVVAGVVGKRMPQYCLFGDAVNTASRMQTNSESSRIHISEPCHRCLKESDFVTVFRGHLNIKGKGEMKTYWLVGHKGDPLVAQKCSMLKAERRQKFMKQQQKLSTLRSSPTPDRNPENGFDFHGIYANISCYNLGAMSVDSANSPPLDDDTDDDDDSPITPNTANSSGTATPCLPIRFTLDSETPSQPGTPSLTTSPGRGEITPEALQMALSTSTGSPTPDCFVCPPSPPDENSPVEEITNLAKPRFRRLCGTSTDSDDSAQEPTTNNLDCSGLCWQSSSSKDKTAFSTSNTQVNPNECQGACANPERPSAKFTASDTCTQGPSAKFTGAHTCTQGPSAKFTGAHTCTQGPSAKFTGADTCTQGPSAKFTGANTCTQGPIAKFTGADTCTQGPSAKFTGAATCTQGPIAKFTGADTCTQGPSAKFTGAATCTQGPSAQFKPLTEISAQTGSSSAKHHGAAEFLSKKTSAILKKFNRHSQKAGAWVHRARAQDQKTSANDDRNGHGERNGAHDPKARAPDPRKGPHELRISASDPRTSGYELTNGTHDLRRSRQEQVACSGPLEPFINHSLSMCPMQAIESDIHVHNTPFSQPHSLRQVPPRTHHKKSVLNNTNNSK